MTQDLIQKVKIFYSGLLRRKKEEDEIPEHWRNYDDEDVYIAVDDTPVTVEPTFVSVKPKYRYRIPLMGLPWLKIKRVTAFLLLIVSVISAYGFALSYAPALAYYLPTSIILLDYLYRTRHSERMKWYILDDVEEQ